MSKKIVSLLTVVILTMVMTVPAFAAESPNAQAAMTMPVSVPADVALSKGYAVTPEVQVLTTTTIQQALQLNFGAVSDPVNGVTEGASNPADIAMAKLDTVMNTALQSYIAKNGGEGIIVASKSLSAAKAGTRRINIALAGANPGDKVTVLYYVPGDPNPHYKTATVKKNGKLGVKLPVPCTYHIVK